METYTSDKKEGSEKSTATLNLTKDFQDFRNKHIVNNDDE